MFRYQVDSMRGGGGSLPLPSGTLPSLSSETQSDSRSTPGLEAQANSSLTPSQLESAQQGLGQIEQVQSERTMENQPNQRHRRGEGEAPAALPMEGATRAPVIDLQREVLSQFESLRRMANPELKREGLLALYSRSLQMDDWETAEAIFRNLKDIYPMGSVERLNLILEVYRSTAPGPRNDLRILLKSCIENAAQLLLRAPAQETVKNRAERLLALHAYYQSHSQTRQQDEQGSLHQNDLALFRAAQDFRHSLRGRQTYSAEDLIQAQRLVQIDRLLMESPYRGTNVALQGKNFLEAMLQERQDVSITGQPISDLRILEAACLQNPRAPQRGSALHLYFEGHLFLRHHYAERDAEVARASSPASSAETPRSDPLRSFHPEAFLPGLRQQWTTEIQTQIDEGLSQVPARRRESLREQVSALTPRVSADLETLFQNALQEADLHALQSLSLASASAPVIQTLLRGHHLLSIAQAHASRPGSLSQRRFQSALRAADLFSRLGLLSHTREALLPLENWRQYQIGQVRSQGFRPETHGDLCLALQTLSQRMAEIYEAVGTREGMQQANVCLQNIVELDTLAEHRITAIHQQAELVSGLQALNNGNPAQALHLFRTHPQNPLAQPLIRELESRRRLARIDLQMQVARPFLLELKNNREEHGLSPQRNIRELEHQVDSFLQAARLLVEMGEAENLPRAMARLMQEDPRFREDADLRAFFSSSEVLPSRVRNFFEQSSNLDLPESAVFSQMEQLRDEMVHPGYMAQVGHLISAVWHRDPSEIEEQITQLQRNTDGTLLGALGHVLAFAPQIRISLALSPLMLVPEFRSRILNVSPSTMLQHALGFRSDIARSALGRWLRGQNTQSTYLSLQRATAAVQDPLLLARALFSPNHREELLHRFFQLGQEIDGAFSEMEAAGSMDRFGQTAQSINQSLSRLSDQNIVQRSRIFSQETAPDAGTLLAVGDQLASASIVGSRNRMELATGAITVGGRVVGTGISCLRAAQLARTGRVMSLTGQSALRTTADVMFNTTVHQIHEVGSLEAGGLRDHAGLSAREIAKSGLSGAFSVYATRRMQNVGQRLLRSRALGHVGADGMRVLRGGPLARGLTGSGSWMAENVVWEGVGDRMGDALLGGSSRHYDRTHGGEAAGQSLRDEVILGILGEVVGDVHGRPAHHLTVVLHRRMQQHRVEIAYRPYLERMGPLQRGGNHSLAIAWLAAHEEASGRLEDLHEYIPRDAEHRETLIAQILPNGMTIENLSETERNRLLFHASVQAYAHGQSLESTTTQIRSRTDNFLQALHEGGLPSPSPFEKGGYRGIFPILQLVATQHSPERILALQQQAPRISEILNQALGHHLPEDISPELRERVRPILLSRLIDLSEMNPERIETAARMMNTELSSRFALTRDLVATHLQAGYSELSRAEQQEIFVAALEAGQEVPTSQLRGSLTPTFQVLRNYYENVHPAPDAETRTAYRQADSSARPSFAHFTHGVLQQTTLQNLPQWIRQQITMTSATQPLGVHPDSLEAASPTNLNEEQTNSQDEVEALGFSTNSDGSAARDQQNSEEDETPLVISPKLEKVPSPKSSEPSQSSFVLLTSDGSSALSPKVQTPALQLSEQEGGKDGSQRAAVKSIDDYLEVLFRARSTGTRTDRLIDYLKGESDESRVQILESVIQKLWKNFQNTDVDVFFSGLDFIEKLLIHQQEELLNDQYFNKFLTISQLDSLVRLLAEALACNNRDTRLHAIEVFDSLYFGEFSENHKKILIQALIQDEGNSKEYLDIISGGDNIFADDVFIALQKFADKKRAYEFAKLSIGSLAQAVSEQENWENVDGLCSVPRGLSSQEYQVLVDAWEKNCRYNNKITITNITTEFFNYLSLNTSQVASLFRIFIQALDINVCSEKYLKLAKYLSVQNLKILLQTFNDKQKVTFLSVYQKKIGSILSDSTVNDSDLLRIVQLLVAEPELGSIISKLWDSPAVQGEHFPPLFRWAMSQFATLGMCINELEKGNTQALQYLASFEEGALKKVFRELGKSRITWEEIYRVLESGAFVKDETTLQRALVQILEGALTPKPNETLEDFEDLRSIIGAIDCSEKNRNTQIQLYGVFLEFLDKRVEIKGVSNLQREILETEIQPYLDQQIPDHIRIPAEQVWTQFKNIWERDDTEATRNSGPEGAALLLGPLLSLGELKTNAELALHSAHQMFDQAALLIHGALEMLSSALHSPLWQILPSFLILGMAQWSKNRGKKKSSLSPEPSPSNPPAPIQKAAPSYPNIAHTQRILNLLKQSDEALDAKTIAERLTAQGFSLEAHQVTGFLKRILPHHSALSAYTNEQGIVKYEFFDFSAQFADHKAALEKLIQTDLDSLNTLFDLSREATSSLDFLGQILREHDPASVRQALISLRLGGGTLLEIKAGLRDAVEKELLLEEDMEGLLQQIEDVVSLHAQWTTILGQLDASTPSNTRVSTTAHIFGGANNAVDDDQFHFEHGSRLERQMREGPLTGVYAENGENHSGGKSTALADPAPVNDRLEQMAMPQAFAEMVRVNPRSVSPQAADPLRDFIAAQGGMGNLVQVAAASFATALFTGLSVLFEADRNAEKAAEEAAKSAARAAASAVKAAREAAEALVIARKLEDLEIQEALDELEAKEARSLRQQAYDLAFSDALLKAMSDDELCALLREVMTSKMENAQAFAWELVAKRGHSRQSLLYLLDCLLQAPAAPLNHTLKVQILRLIHSGDEMLEIRAHAVFAKNGDRLALDALHAAVKNLRADLGKPLRLEAIRCLGLVRKAESLPVLEEAMKEEIEAEVSFIVLSFLVNPKSILISTSADHDLLIKAAEKTSNLLAFERRLKHVPGLWRQMLKKLAENFRDSANETYRMRLAKMLIEQDLHREAARMLEPLPFCNSTGGFHEAFFLRLRCKSIGRNYLLKFTYPLSQPPSFGLLESLHDEDVERVFRLLDPIFGELRRDNNSKDLRSLLLALCDHLETGNFFEFVQASADYPRDEIRKAALALAGIFTTEKSFLLLKEATQDSNPKIRNVAYAAMRRMYLNGDEKAGEQLPGMAKTPGPVAFASSDMRDDPPMRVFHAEDSTDPTARFRSRVEGRTDFANVVTHKEFELVIRPLDSFISLANKPQLIARRSGGSGIFLQALEVSQVDESHPIAGAVGTHIKFKILEGNNEGSLELYVQRKRLLLHTINTNGTGANLHPGAGSIVLNWLALQAAQTVAEFHVVEIENPRVLQILKDKALVDPEQSVVEIVYRTSQGLAIHEKGKLQDYPALLRKHPFSDAVHVRGIPHPSLLKDSRPSFSTSRASTTAFASSDIRDDPTMQAFHAEDSTDPTARFRARVEDHSAFASIKDEGELSALLIAGVGREFERNTSGLPSADTVDFSDPQKQCELFFRRQLVKLLASETNQECKELYERALRIFEGDLRDLSRPGAALRLQSLQEERPWDKNDKAFRDFLETWMNPFSLKAGAEILKHATPLTPSMFPPPRKREVPQRQKPAQQAVVDVSRVAWPPPGSVRQTQWRSELAQFLNEDEEEIRLMVWSFPSDLSLMASLGRAAEGAAIAAAFQALYWKCLETADSPGRQDAEEKIRRVFKAILLSQNSIQTLPSETVDEIARILGVSRKNPALPFLLPLAPLINLESGLRYLADSTQSFTHGAAQVFSIASLQPSLGAMILGALVTVVAAVLFSSGEDKTEKAMEAFADILSRNMRGCESKPGSHYAAALNNMASVFMGYSETEINTALTGQIPEGLEEEDVSGIQETFLRFSGILPHLKRQLAALAPDQREAYADNFLNAHNARSSYKNFHDFIATLSSDLRHDLNLENLPLTSDLRNYLLAGFLPPSTPSNPGGSTRAFASPHMRDDPTMSTWAEQDHIDPAWRMRTRAEGHRGLASMDSGQDNGGGGESLLENTERLRKNLCVYQEEYLLQLGKLESNSPVLMREAKTLRALFKDESCSNAALISYLKIIYCLPHGCEEVKVCAQTLRDAFQEGIDNRDFARLALHWAIYAKLIDHFAENDALQEEQALRNLFKDENPQARQSAAHLYHLLFKRCLNSKRHYKTFIHGLKVLMALYHTDKDYNVRKEAALACMRLNEIIGQNFSLAPHLQLTQEIKKRIARVRDRLPGLSLLGRFNAGRHPGRRLKSRGMDPHELKELQVGDAVEGRVVENNGQLYQQRHRVEEAGRVFVAVDPDILFGTNADLTVEVAGTLAELAFLQGDQVGVLEGTGKYRIFLSPGQVKNTGVFLQNLMQRKSTQTSSPFELLQDPSLRQNLRPGTVVYLLGDYFTEDLTRLANIFSRYAAKGITLIPVQVQAVIRASQLYLNLQNLEFLVSRDYLQGKNLRERKIKQTEVEKFLRCFDGLGIAKNEKDGEGSFIEQVLDQFMQEPASRNYHWPTLVHRVTSKTEEIPSLPMPRDLFNRVVRIFQNDRPQEFIALVDEAKQKGWGLVLDWVVESIENNAGLRDGRYYDFTKSVAMREAGERGDPIPIDAWGPSEEALTTMFWRERHNQLGLSNASMPTPVDRPGLAGFVDNLQKRARALLNSQVTAKAGGMKAEATHGSPVLAKAEIGPMNSGVTDDDFQNKALVMKLSEALPEGSEYLLFDAGGSFDLAHGTWLPLLGFSLAELSRGGGAKITATLEKGVQVRDVPVPLGGRLLAQQGQVVQFELSKSRPAPTLTQQSLAEFRHEAAGIYGENYLELVQAPALEDVPEEIRHWVKQVQALSVSEALRQIQTYVLKHYTYHAYKGIKLSMFQQFQRRARAGHLQAYEYFHTVHQWGGGHCSELSELTLMLLRLAGIPALKADGYFAQGKEVRQPAHAVALALLPAEDGGLHLQPVETSSAFMPSTLPSPQPSPTEGRGREDVPTVELSPIHKAWQQRWDAADEAGRRAISKAWEFYLDLLTNREPSLQFQGVSVRELMLDPDYYASYPTSKVEAPSFWMQRMKAEGLSPSSEELQQLQAILNKPSPNTPRPSSFLGLFTLMSLGNITGLPSLPGGMQLALLGLAAVLGSGKFGEWITRLIKRMGFGPRSSEQGVSIETALVRSQEKEQLQERREQLQRLIPTVEELHEFLSENFLRHFTSKLGRHVDQVLHYLLGIAETPELSLTMSEQKWLILMGELCELEPLLKMLRQVRQEQDCSTTLENRLSAILTKVAPHVARTLEDVSTTRRVMGSPVPTLGEIRKTTVQVEKILKDFDAYFSGQKGGARSALQSMSDEHHLGVEALTYGIKLLDELYQYLDLVKQISPSALSSSKELDKNFLDLHHRLIVTSLPKISRFLEALKAYHENYRVTVGIWSYFSKSATYRSRSAPLTSEERNDFFPIDSPILFVPKLGENFNLHRMSEAVLIYHLHSRMAFVNIPLLPDVGETARAEVFQRAREKAIESGGTLLLENFEKGYLKIRLSQGGMLILRIEIRDEIQGLLDAEALEKIIQEDLYVGISPSQRPAAGPPENPPAVQGAADTQSSAATWRPPETLQNKDK